MTVVLVLVTLVAVLALACWVHDLHLEVRELRRVVDRRAPRPARPGGRT